MVDGGTIYVAVVGALLLVALALGLRVLRDIVYEARERRRRRKAGDLDPSAEDEKDADDETDERSPPTTTTEVDAVAEKNEGVHRDDASVTCPQCGAVNDPEFSYCRQCASRLRPVG